MLGDIIILFQVLLVVTFSAAAVLAIYVWQHRDKPGAPALLGFLIASIVWAAAYACEIRSVSIETKILWTKIEYFGIATMAPFWATVIFHQVGRPEWASTRRLALLLAFPAFILALVWTNDFHRLYWTESTLEEVGGVPMLAFSYGPFFWTQLIYSYGLLASSTLLLTYNIISDPALYRGRRIALFLAVMFTWLANAAYIFRLGPLPYFDLTPIAFSLSAIPFSQGILQFRLLEMIPIARSRVMNQMQEGFVVLDRFGKIVDINPFAAEMGGTTPNLATGKMFVDVFIPKEDGESITSESDFADRQLAFNSGEKQGIYRFNRSDLQDRFKRHIGAVYTVTDVTKAVEATQKLEGSERQYRLLADNISDVIWVVDLQMQLQYISPSIERLRGYTFEELKGEPLEEAITPRSLKESQARIQGILGQANNNSAEVLGKTFAFDLELIRKDGSTVWARTSASMQLDEQGNPIGFQGIMREISEERAALEAMEESERRYRALFEQSRDCVYIHDFSGKFLDANSAAKELLGFKNQNVTKLSFDSMLGPTQIAAALNNAKSIYKHGVQQDSDQKEFTLRRPDGSEIEVELQGAAIYKDGVPVAILGIARDITERKRAEREIRRLNKELGERVSKQSTQLFEEEERYRTLVETMTDSVGILDREGRITYVNDQTCEMTGYSREELMGQTMFFVLSEKSQETFKEEMELRKDGKSRSYEMEVKTKSGEIVPTLVSPRPLFDENGEFAGSFSVVTDISELKKSAEALRKSEEELRQSQKMEAIGRLAGGIAHDFNNLMTAVNGYSSIALENLNPSDPLRGDIQEILKAGERAAELTRQLLAFGRKQILQPRNIDVGVVITGMEKMLNRIIREDIKLTVFETPHLYLVHADPIQIEQIVMNLVINARDAMPDGGRIQVDVENTQLDDSETLARLELGAGNYVKISVVDNGHGIEKQLQERIFEPFFTSKEVGEGTGLGLSTVFGIVKQSNGGVLVNSEPDKGATFEIYLPRAEADVAAKIENGQASPGSQDEGSETIIVVEDEEVIRNLLVRTLERRGYTVLAARDGSEAFYLSEQNTGPAQLLITDVIMPGLNGAQVAERLTKERPELKVLYISGYSDQIVAKQGALDTGVHFLPKPFDSDLLHRKVREILDTPR